MSFTAEKIAELPVALTLVYYADTAQRPTLGTVVPLPTAQARLELLRERDEEATWEDAEWR